MKTYLITLTALVLSFCSANAARLSFDQKYVTVGVFTNSELPQFSSNPNIRLYHITNLGSAISGSKDARNELLKALFDFNNGKPNIDKLYRDALSQVTGEERQIAEQDMSADTESVLKNDIVRQLLKNNYVVDIVKKPKLKKNGEPATDINNKPKYYYEWSVYHIDIDEEIINQAFNNWDNADAFSQIEIPLSLVARDRISEKNLPLIIVNIAKKVPQFAIRGVITSNHPTLANTTSVQGIRTGDIFKVYQMYEDQDGNLFSKAISEARVLEANPQQTKLKIIAGRYPNYKNGDVAALYGRYRFSLSLQGVYSMGGNDPKIGGRLIYEWMPRYTKGGVSNYLYAGVEYQQFKQDPDGVWFKNIENRSEFVKPQLKYLGFLFGYGFGVNFLTKFELSPYILGGVNYFFMSGLKDGAFMWNSEKQIFELFGGKNINSETKSAGFSLVGGVRLMYNLCYPFQLVLGAEYESYLFPDEKFHPISKRHEWSRLGFTGGFRLTF